MDNTDVQRANLATVQRMNDEIDRLRAENDRLKDELLVAYKTGGDKLLAQKARIAELEALLLAARETVEEWTPDESNALRCEEEPLNRWYALRDRIDAALSGREG
jgi:hypothetical protein